MNGNRVEQNIWRKLKYDVMTRDKYTCQVCLKQLEDHIHIHHIIPKNRQGLDTMDNLVSVCEPCHKIIELQRNVTKSYNESNITRSNNNTSSSSSLIFREAFHCNKCQHEWISNIYTHKNPPNACSKCKSPSWNLIMKHKEADKEDSKKK